MKKPLKKKRLISIPSLKKRAQTVFNNYIRDRDKIDDESFKCISCQRVLPLNKCNAGHLFPVKGNNRMRYDERNVNSECIHCNGFNEAHVIWYSIHLKEKIGEEKFTQLLNDVVNQSRIEWTREELNEIIEKYKV